MRPLYSVPDNLPSSVDEYEPRIFFESDIEMFNQDNLKNLLSPHPKPLEVDNEIFDERFSVLDNSLRLGSSPKKDQKLSRRVSFNEAGTSFEELTDSFNSSRVSRRIDFGTHGNNEAPSNIESNQPLRIGQEKYPGRSHDKSSNVNKSQSEPLERYFDPENLETSINTIANAYLGSPANISDDKITDFATTYIDYLNEKFNTKFRENEVNEESFSSQEVPKDHRAISLRSANISDDKIKGSEKNYLEYLEEMLSRKNKEEVNEVNKKSASLHGKEPNDSRLIPFRIEGGKIYPEFGDKNSVVQPLPAEASPAQSQSTYSYLLPSRRASSLPDNSDNFSSSRSKSNRSTVRDEDTISQKIMMVNKAGDTDEDVLPAQLPKPEAISVPPSISEPESEITLALPTISAPPEITSESVSKTLQTSTKPNKSLKGVANINYSIEDNFLVFNTRAIKDKPLFYTENKSYLNKISSFFLRCFGGFTSHDSVLEKELTKGLVKDYGFIAIAKKEDEELIKSFISELRDSKAVFANWQNQDDPKNNLYSKIHKLESGFENNRIFREKIVKLLELGLNIKQECSRNADLDKLIEVIYKNNNIPDDSKLKDREMGEVVKFANYLLKNNSTNDLNEEKINQVKTRTLEYANNLDKINISPSNRINLAPVFPNSIKSGQFLQTKIVEERIPISPADVNSTIEPTLTTSGSLSPSTIIKPKPSNKGMIPLFPRDTGSEAQHGQS